MSEGKMSKPEMEKCERCNGSGIIGVDTRRGSYIGPGPVPEDARNACEETCDECRGYGVVREVA